MTTYAITPYEHVEVVTATAELLAVDCTWSGATDFPPPHVHPAQDEHFEVRSGRLRARIGDDERVYGPGEAFDIPRGTPHTLLPADGHAEARWEVRPALDTEAFWAAMAQTGGNKLRQLSVVRRHPSSFRLTGALGLLVSASRGFR